MSLKSAYDEVFKRHKKSKNKKTRILTSFFGLLYGALLTIALYYLFTTQFDVHPHSAKWIFSILGVPLSIGCSTSRDLRCTILLFLPHFFSKRGRTALLAWVFAMSLTGPTRNIVMNMEVLGHSLNCAEDELKEALNAVLVIVKEPILAIKEAIRNVLHEIRKVIRRVKEAVMRIVRVLYSIINSIKKAFKWLHDAVNICNNSIGTPFQRCEKVFEEAFESCLNSSVAVTWMCGTMDNAKYVCHGIKFMDHVCEFLLFMKENIINKLTDDIQEYIESITKIFKVSVTIDHQYSFKTKASKKYKTVLKDILQEMDKKADEVMSCFRISVTIGLVFFIWMFFKVQRYRKKYLKDDRFDNFYITHHVKMIDKHFKTFSKKTLLPLKVRERSKYITLLSCRIAKSECHKLLRAFTMLSLSTLQILATLLIDHSLYWLLSKVRFYGRKIDLDPSNEPQDLIKFQVKGEGILADMCEGIANSFKALTRVSIDTVPCLPDATTPNYALYEKILTILGVIWIFLLLEPYGLRIRHKILEYYYPRRAEERAIWLYNHIIGQRKLFVTLARRKAREKFLKDEAGAENYYCWFTKMWKRLKIKFAFVKFQCSLCQETFTKRIMLRDCIQIGCKGRYCFRCYDALEKTCPLCMDPLSYGDMSDYSEEWGSTDDEDFHVSRYLKNQIK
ncbi:DC-STAMP domain-containing protein 2-like [Culicoides brevitarsis]|uniref:DC-STAMP domain-containing protein 2-like n=1 Tax=Culicoides brevitarsis TaxID=469753 RepID=UPI00307B9980